MVYESWGSVEEMFASLSCGKQPMTRSRPPLDEQSLVRKNVYFRKWRRK